MANIYWNDKKADFDLVKDELMAKMPEVTDYAFTVIRKDGDVICVSENEGGGNSPTSPYKPDNMKIIPAKYKGWRVIKLIVPIGYIDAFLVEKEKA